VFEQNSVFKDKKVNKYLSALCDKYVVVQADKASKYNDIANLSCDYLKFLVKISIFVCRITRVLGNTKFFHWDT
jgi:hypothetical protein